MLGSFDIVTFVLTTDPDRAKSFYAEKLGLRFISQDQYAVVFDAHGTMLRVTHTAGHKAAEHTVLGWNVPDITAAQAALSSAGIKFEKYSFLEQDELGIWTSPDNKAKVAWFKDPDGNVLSISQL